jgi:hypothetical protein
VSITVKVTSKRKFEDRRSEERNLEDKALLSLVRKWKFYLMIQTSGVQQWFSIFCKKNMKLHVFFNSMFCGGVPSLKL